MYFSGTIYDYDLFVLWGKIQERGLQKKLKVTTRGHPASSEHILSRWGPRKTLRSEKETCPSGAVRLLLVEVLH